jgi:NAD(P)H-nitrite reductase large subunit
MNYVIIGNSTAAIGTIEGIRQIDPTGKITVISDEPHHTYSRPLISYLIYGKTTQEKMRYRNADFYEKNNVETILGKKAVAIDPAKKIVTLDDKTEVPYDKLMVATGSRPFVPPSPGIEKVKNCFSFMKLDDALALEKVLTKDSKVLIVGAGLIGMKAAEGILNKVGSITIVDLAPRILPSILTEEASHIVQNHVEKKGVTFILGDSVAEFSPNSALLNSGHTVDFDILIMAVGVRPNTELVSQIGGQVGRGITIDPTCQTSLPNIYAAGDCVECFDLTAQLVRILAILPNAYIQGECAGINMAGGECSFQGGIPMNAIGFFGLHMVTAGTYEGESHIVSEGDNYKALYFKDGHLIGYILIGDVTRAGIYTSIIREMIPIDEIDLELLKEQPQLMMFGHHKRKEKLGGVPRAN